MLLRSAIRTPESFQGHSTGDQDLDGLLHSWSSQEKTELQQHDFSNALPRAMNDAFLSEQYSPESVRSHALLGPYLRQLGDDQLHKIQGLMVAKKDCDEQIET